MKGPGGNVDALSGLHLKSATIFDCKVAIFLTYTKSERFAQVRYLNAVDAFVVVVIVHWVVWRQKDSLIVDNRGAALS